MPAPQCTHRHDTAVTSRPVLSSQVREARPGRLETNVTTARARPDHPYLSDFGLAKGAASSTGPTGT